MDNMEKGGAMAPAGGAALLVNDIRMTMFSVPC